MTWLASWPRRRVGHVMMLEYVPRVLQCSRVLSWQSRAGRWDLAGGT